ncbi:MAG: glucan biosynthesis protein, partial [Alphaproteobacteria bacterium]
INLKWLIFLAAIVVGLVYWAWKSGIVTVNLANRRKFVIDFSGFGTLDVAKEIAAGNIWADISNRAGTISNVRLMYTPSINGASLYFDIEPNTDITELRLLLRNKAENNKVISEVWSYQLRQ